MASSQERWIVRKAEKLKGTTGETLTKLLTPAVAGGDFSLLFDKNYREDKAISAAKGVFVATAAAELGALYLTARSRPLLGLAFYGASRLANFISEGVMDFHAYPPQEEPISLSDYRKRKALKPTRKALVG